MITINHNEQLLEFETEPELFSPRKIDAGTLAMLSQIDFLKEEKVLDLGCGYGIVGILAASVIGEQSVVMSDCSATAVRVARQNAMRNGFPGIRVVQSDAYDRIEDTDFSLILSNPPYHTDFSVAKRFIQGGYRRLQPEGRMVMVVKRLLWYQKKLTSVFGGVKVRECNGYYVLIAEKREENHRLKRSRQMISHLAERGSLHAEKCKNTFFTL